MRWDCPHCEAALSVPDEKLSLGWNFSRCYRCSNHALVRKSDGVVLKVDRGNPLEDEKPKPAPAVAAPVAAAPTITVPVAVASEPVAPAPADPVPPTIAQAPNPVIAAEPQTLSIPDRPVIKPVSGGRNRSGGMPMFKPAPTSNPAPLPQAPARVITPPVFRHRGFPKPLPEVPEKDFRSHLIPAIVATAGIVAIASGVYLYVQGQALWQKARASAQKPVSMQRVASRKLVDEVRQNAMAPVRPPVPVIEQKITPLTIQVRVKNALLRSGPGQQYPILSIAKEDFHYVVLDWQDRWFKVGLSNGQTQAWIRNDMVQLLSEPRPLPR